MKTGLRLPPIRAYMDDFTTLTTTNACTKRLLGKLHDNIKWARMSVKPSKSRSISVVKGKLTEYRFFIGGEPIPTVAEKPIKSLGRWYDASLRDTAQVEQIREDTIRNLMTINHSLLPCRLKLWCLQFGLLHASGGLSPSITSHFPRSTSCNDWLAPLPKNGLASLGALPT